jgi:hypothetical protein
MNTRAPCGGTGLADGVAFGASLAMADAQIKTRAATRTVRMTLLRGLGLRDDTPMDLQRLASLSFAHTERR